MTLEKNIDDLMALIKNSKHLVALTGAGVSTLSGIPDFRTDKSGIWDRHDQSKIFDVEYFKRHPQDFYRFARECLFISNKPRPAITHKLLAHLENQGILKCVITQNIDGLHHAAGSKKVFELHGSAKEAHCLKCGSVYSQYDIEKKIEDDDVPFCDYCGGVIKPDIVFYGEMLPQYQLEGAIMESHRCDVMLILGTSLVVYPAAYLPDNAVRRGAAIVILTKEPTSYDARASLVIHEDLTKICQKLIEKFNLSVE